MFRFANKPLLLAAILLLISSGLCVASPITVTPVVTPIGPAFQYDYTVTNMTGLDLPVLDIAVGTGAPISGLTAPAGFDSAYDPVLGLVSFLEDFNVFGTTAVSGFIFDSPLGPSPTTFTATLLDANFNVSTMSGPTTGPVAATVPEPASMYLLAGAACLLFLRRAFASYKPSA
jgi:hypothetical protein